MKFNKPNPEEVTVTHQKNVLTPCFCTNATSGMRSSSVGGSVVVVVAMGMASPPPPSSAVCAAAHPAPRWLFR